jgi:hypothetical protein
MLNKIPPKYLFRLTVVKGFKVIHQAQDVLVSLRDLAHNVDFIPDHMFTSFHELLVDNLDSIKLVGFNLVQKTANECLLRRACSLCKLTCMASEDQCNHKVPENTILDGG